MPTVAEVEKVLKGARFTQGRVVGFREGFVCVAMKGYVCVMWQTDRDPEGIQATRDAMIRAYGNTLKAKFKVRTRQNAVEVR